MAREDEVETVLKNRIAILRQGGDATLQGGLHLDATTALAKLMDAEAADATNAARNDWNTRMWLDSTTLGTS